MRGRLILVLLVLFLTINISAIRINEVELNPVGTDTGNEWVELYNNGEINLEGYRLINGDNNTINLSGSFSEYYVYTFSKQWLDNDNEQVFLYKNNELIDETIILKDGENDNFAWSYCLEWKFYNSTKGEENDCDEPEETNNNIIINETDDEENITETPEEEPKPKNITINKKEETNNTQTITAKTTESKTLYLSAKDIKTNNGTENLNLNNKAYAIYGLISLCTLLLVLFLIKFLRQKNGIQ